MCKHLFRNNNNPVFSAIFLCSSRPNPGRIEKIKLNFYFHTSFWCLKRFYKGLKGLYKTFWETTKKCENKSLLIFTSIQLSEMQFLHFSSCFTVVLSGTFYKIKFTTENIDSSEANSLEANRKVRYKMRQKHQFIDVL